MYYTLYVICCILYIIYYLLYIIFNGYAVIPPTPNSPKEIPKQVIYVNMYRVIY